MRIPLCVPCVDEREEKAILKVLRSGWYAHGPMNEEFETKFAEAIGVKHAIGMNSCTSALQIAILAQGIKGEVIVPSFTFVASVNAIVTSGAVPVFIDVDPTTYNLDTSLIESLITPRTEAIMPVHWGGAVCNMSEITRIAEKHGLAIIEDSAETIGGLHRERAGGSFGTGCFSLYPTKNMTTGEGGVLTTNDSALMERCRTLIGHGISKTVYEREHMTQPWEREAIIPGYNYRMSNLTAAIGVEQLNKLHDMNDMRRANALYLKNGLKDIPWIDLPYEGEDDYHVYQMFAIKLKHPMERNRFVHGLREYGIGASVHFDPPVHLQPAYRELGRKCSFSHTEELSRVIVSLPMYPQLGTMEMDYIIDTIHKIVTEWSGNSHLGKRC